MRKPLFLRGLALIGLGLLVAGPALSAVVAGIYGGPSDGSPEMQDLLGGLGINTFFINGGDNPAWITPDAEEAGRRGMHVYWCAYYNSRSEMTSGFAANPRRYVTADGRRTEETPCPLDAVYWERTIGERAGAAARLALQCPGLTGTAALVDLYAANERWTGPCYCDYCWQEFFRQRAPAVPAYRRAKWLARHSQMRRFAAFEHSRVTEICAAIRERARAIAIRPDFRFAIMPYRDFFRDDLVRGFGTPAMPVYSLNEPVYYPRSLTPSELRTMMEVTERGLPAIPLVGLRVLQQTPELTRAYMYQAGQLFGGYWLYEGFPWRDILVARNLAHDRLEARIVGSPAEWREAIRAANAALAAARGPRPFVSGFAPPALLGHWPDAPAPPTGVSTGRVIELGLPLADEASFTPDGIEPGRYRINIYVRHTEQPRLTLGIGNRRRAQLSATPVGPEVWRVDFGPRRVTAAARWTISGASGARLLYLACGAIFPAQFSVAGPYDNPGRDPHAVFPPDDPEFDDWRTMRTDFAGYLDLARRFGKLNNAAAYAALEVWSPDAHEATLLVGSDDEVRVLLNGAVVLDHSILRHASPDADVTAVQLRPGWNRLLVRVVNAGDDWGLYLRIYDADRPVRYRQAR